MGRRRRLQRRRRRRHPLALDRRHQPATGDHLPVAAARQKPSPREPRSVRDRCRTAPRHRPLAVGLAKDPCRPSVGGRRRALIRFSTPTTGAPSSTNRAHESLLVRRGPDRSATAGGRLTCTDAIFMLTRRPRVASRASVYSRARRTASWTACGALRGARPVHRRPEMPICVRRAHRFPQWLLSFRIWRRRFRWSGVGRVIRWEWWRVVSSLPGRLQMPSIVGLLEQHEPAPRSSPLTPASSARSCNRTTTSLSARDLAPPICGSWPNTSPRD